MENYQEIKLEKCRRVIVFSFFFLTFLSQELIVTKEFFGFSQIKQQKVKIRRSYLDEYDYQIRWVKYYRWRTIKIE
jgi:hypothetical protein